MRDVDIDRRPTLPGVIAAIFATIGVGLILLEYTLTGFVPVAIGIVAITIGGFRGRWDITAVGLAMLPIAILAGGVFFVPVGPMLAAAVLSVVAWDLLNNAFSLGQQLGRTTNTIRVETIHGAATLLGGTIVAGIGYGIYAVSPGGWPLTALILVMLAGLLLALALEL